MTCTLHQVKIIVFIIFMYQDHIQKVIDQAIFVLEHGGVILYPADTIWGIGCDATDQKAVGKVYDIKGREHQKPLIVLVSDLTQLYSVVTSVHPRIDTLLHFHERPLTVIYPQARKEYLHLAARDGSLGVRLVKSGFCHDLISAYQRPLVSTSANRSGEPSPAKFGSISSQIISLVDLAVPAFTEKNITGLPSVIARYDENGELDFLRQN
ncbi:MAG TPA: L-threonylcarbamoyladenylate synthase [Saprospiraceae bacterium]|nr:L-threonylcarbamoyladenylate synthase [Saprospiraceae bacterium]